MKKTASLKWIGLLMGLVVLGVIVKASTERFQPEFIDRRQVLKTAVTQDSSYDQRTNHMEYESFTMDPIQGVQTPFQVNQYKAYVP
jgi:hypothetical protein